MKECVIVGYPNSGKTLFALNFAGFLGAKTVDVTFRSHDGFITCRHFSLADAKRELCSPTLHKTRLLQSIVLTMFVGKAAVTFKLTDTCGVVEEIHPDYAIRRAMAQTLTVIRSADFILHIVDLERNIRQDNPGSLLGVIDQEIYQYGITRMNYIILANKIDLPAAKENLQKTIVGFPRATVLPVSALYTNGFKEVKAFVSRNI